MKAAFSLVELLAVVAIGAILAVLALPALGGIQSSFQLSRSAASAKGGIELARQLAVTRNASVYLDLCQTPDSSGKECFNTLVLRGHRPDGTWEMLAKPIRLPAGFSMATNAAWSSLMTLPATNVPLLNSSVPARRIRFLSTGAADLSTSSNWNLTVFQDRRPVDFSPNFITLVLFPATGRTVTYQPQ